MRIVWDRLQGIVVVLLVGVALSSCGAPRVLHTADSEVLAAPLGTISIYQLAGRLDMRVTESSPTRATIEDERNMVLIFGEPRGSTYVNGSPVGESGGITTVRGMLFVPMKLEAEIRPVLRPPIQPVRELKRERKKDEPERRPVRLGRVVLDPGHGGTDPGATSGSGLEEKSVNLSVALSVADELKQRGVEVVLTRGSDTFVKLNRRADIANERGPNLFVSIHADHHPRKSMRGFTVYVSRSPSAKSRAAAETVARSLRRLRMGGHGVRKANYRVLVRTSCPAVLVELGYLSNRWEADRLSKQPYQQRLARAIADGVVEFLKQK